MKQISKFSILLLLIVSFSCADDNDIIDETSIDTSNYIVYSDSEYPDDDTNNVYVSDGYLRDFFGWSQVITGPINEIDGILDTLVETAYWENFGEPTIPCSEFELQDFYLDSSGNLTSLNNAVFEVWTRPIPPVNGNSYPVSANSPLNDGIIDAQEQQDFMIRVLNALTNYPTVSGSSVQDINIQGSYSNTSPFVYIRVKVRLAIC
ncbi:MAG: hypothetical protein ACI9Y7_001904 [Dokdonia sp.]|jgi:hypothetical protein